MSGASAASPLSFAIGTFAIRTAQRHEEKIDFEELSNARKELGEIKLPHVLSFLKENLLEEVEKVVVFAYHKEIIDKLYDALKTFTPGSVEEFERLMCTLPEWGKTIPVKAEGWRGKRYKK